MLQKQGFTLFKAILHNNFNAIFHYGHVFNAILFE
jgi:hypothetical protein